MLSKQRKKRLSRLTQKQLQFSQKGREKNWCNYWEKSGRKLLEKPTNKKIINR